MFDERQIEHISTKEVKVVDATGVGDSFIGSLIAQVINENDIDLEKMKDIIKLSSKVGALTTTKKGTLESIPSIEEL